MVVLKENTMYGNCYVHRYITTYTKKYYLPKQLIKCKYKTEKKQLNVLYTNTNSSEEII